MSIGTVYFQNNAVNYTLSSADANGITGNTALVQSGTETVILAGSNTYTGTTTITNGTLQVGNAGTAGTLGTGNTTITSPASLIFNRSDTAYSYGGNITGTGSVTQNGSGAITLTGADNYSGGTIVNAGTLNVGSATALGAGPLQVNNSTGFGINTIVNLPGAAVTTGSLSGTTGGGIGGTGAINIQSGQLYTVNQTAPGTYAGIIADATTGGRFALGSLSTNALILTGPSTYSGGTTILGGTLPKQEFR